MCEGFGRGWGGGWEGLGWRVRAESPKSNVLRTMAGCDGVFDILPLFSVQSIDMFQH